MTIEEQCCCHNDPSTLLISKLCLYFCFFFSPISHSLHHLFSTPAPIFFVFDFAPLPFFAPATAETMMKWVKSQFHVAKGTVLAFFTTVMLAFKNSIFCVYYFFFQQSLSILSIKVSHLGYCTYIITYRYLSKFQNRQNG